MLSQFLERQRRTKINVHCVGDALLDEYYNVSVKRISPEFPMPIMTSTSEEVVKKPGGVANVAYQFHYLHSNTSLISFSDAESVGVFREHKLNYTPCHTGSAYIPRKRRFLDSGIQVKRWDIEPANYDFKDPDKQREEVLEYTSDMETPDIAILSDYSKGFFDGVEQQWINRYKNCITVVDPKYGPVEKWKNCTVFKPNSQEAEHLTGLKDSKSQAEKLINILKCQAVIITKSGNGFAVLDKDQYYEYMPSEQLALPNSVIGAGDCFSAFLSHAIALGFNYRESAHIAYEAGSKYVQNRMNRPILPVELIQDGIVLPEDLTKRDFKLVFTNGCFDILHSGHLQTLNFAKSKGDKLLVGLNTDSSIKRLKGNSRPIKPLNERLALMAALKMVDYVCTFDEDTPLETIKRCRPDVLVKGGEYDVDKIIGNDLVKEVYQSPMVPDISTTKIINLALS